MDKILEHFIERYHENMVSLKNVRADIGGIWYYINSMAFYSEKHRCYFLKKSNENRELEQFYGSSVIDSIIENKKIPLALIALYEPVLIYSFKEQDLESIMMAILVSKGTYGADLLTDTEEIKLINRLKLFGFPDLPRK